MNCKNLARLTIAGLGMVIPSACGVMSTSHHLATRPTRQSTVTTSSPRATVTLTPSLLPEPTGSFAVGVRIVPSEVPAAVTRVWYPAQRQTGSTSPIYLAKDDSAALGVASKQLEPVVLRAMTDAEPAPTVVPRPVVVLMPGWGSRMALSTALSQDLASNGYIVVSVDPTIGSEDGSALPADLANPGRRLEQVTDALNFVTGRQITTLVGSVDRKRVAIGGHSIAGAIAFQTSITDPRVQAVFDLDGWLHGPALTTPVAVPALVVDASGLDPATRVVIGRTTSAVTVKLTDATHFDVTDLPCLAPALGASAPLFRLGSIGRVGTTTTNKVVLRFLDTVLKEGRPTPSAAWLATDLPGVQVAKTR